MVKKIQKSATGKSASASASALLDSQLAANVRDSAQQIWLAGMGAVSRAQQEGPAAFQEAVAEGLALLNRSRSSAEKLIRDVFESAQESVQSRIENARDQASETWDNLEALFQGRVQKALQQLGVPSPDEIRLLTKRVADLNDSVKQLAARSDKAGRGGTRRSVRPARSARKGQAARRKSARAR